MSDSFVTSPATAKQELQFLTRPYRPEAARGLVFGDFGMGMQ